MRLVARMLFGLSLTTVIIIACSFLGVGNHKYYDRSTVGQYFHSVYSCVAIPQYQFMEMMHCDRGDGSQFFYGRWTSLDGSEHNQLIEGG